MRDFEWVRTAPRPVPVKVYDFSPEDEEFIANKVRLGATRAQAIKALMSTKGI